MFGMFGLSRLALQLIATGAILLVGVVSCSMRDRKIEARGAEKVVAAAKKEGVKANAINSRVRSAARRPGAFDRLLKDACRDCKRS